MLEPRSRTILLLLAVLVAVALSISAPPAQAAIFDVPCVEDASALLAAAIQSANDSAGHDVIRLAEGCTYYLTTVQVELNGPNGLPVISDPLTIEGNGARLGIHPDNPVRFRLLITADRVPLAVHDLHLFNGRAYDVSGRLRHGGAILAGGDLILNNVYATGNAATGSGGVVYARPFFAQPPIFVSISGSIFEENETGLKGGALYTNGFLNINNSEFIGNLSRDGNGGGVHSSGGNTTIQNSVFFANQALGHDGGGLYAELNSTTILNTQFTYNSAYHGGGMAFQANTVTHDPRPLSISRAVFTENEAESGGSGILAVGANLILERSIFDGNSGNSEGGALGVRPFPDSTSRIVNNLWTADGSEDTTATIYIRPSEVGTGSQQVLHNTFASSQRGVNAAVELIDVDQGLVANNIITAYDFGIRVSGGSVSAGYNLFYQILNSTQQGPIAPYQGGNNLTANPLFVDAGASDYRVRAQSPAVDSAFNTGMTIDLPGVSRPQGEGWDRGAFEFVDLNRPPTALADAYVTTEGTRLVPPAPGVLGNDSDPDGDTLTPDVRSFPVHAELFVMNGNGSFTYVPESGFVGADHFTYAASDGVAYSDEVTVTITVEAANSAPVSSNDAYETLQDRTLTVAAPGVLANDGDADGDALTAHLQSGPANGTLALNEDGSFTYTPQSGYEGADSFTYTVSDGESQSQAAVVTLAVIGADDNRPPDALGDAFSMAAGTALNVVAPGVLLNDGDVNGDALTAALQSGAANGVLELGEDGSFSYTPHDDFEGEDGFTYRAFDGEHYSETATVRIRVLGDAPVFQIFLPALQNVDG